MANEEHVDLLKQGVDVWNAWRREHPDIRPDLFKADLSGADLSHINLYPGRLPEGILHAAELSGANLSGADLSSAVLTGANFSSANLTGATLSRADLSSAVLYNANLSRARLIGTNLSGTYLNATEFACALFQNTLFVDVDLSDVKGLETTIHYYRSTVDINSVILPADEHTRNHFLRGVGFTETLIEYLPSLLTPRPIKYASLFISYAHQDEAIAKRLYADLRKKDVPCWFAPHDLQPGNYFRERIDQAIHAQDKLLLLLSEYSVQSGWVRYEVELALSRENDQQREILYPIRLDNAIFDSTANWAKSLRATRHIGDFTNWQDETAYQQAFITLLRHLKVSKP